MKSKKREREVTATILRGIILFVGLIVAGFYGMRGEWAASLAGLLAAGVTFFSRWKGGRD